MVREGDSQPIGRLYWCSFLFLLEKYEKKKYENVWLLFFESDSIRLVSYSFAYFWGIRYWSDVRNSGRPISPRRNDVSHSVG